MVYLDTDSAEADICRIMAAHHFDNIRLRIFVDPTSPKGYSKDGFCGLESATAMARRIKAAGMKFTLNFHYSDNWADPDKQYKPAAWENLPPGDALADSVYRYSKSVLLHLSQEGVAPDVIQLGNEINHGFLWPDGYINDNASAGNWAAMLSLYAAGQRAAREVLPKARLMVHLALGGENRLCRQFLDSMINHGAEFDIIGLSYYEQWHETFDDLKANLYDLAGRYSKPVCEYGASTENIAVINDIVRSVPNGRGYGAMAWEPVRALFPLPNGGRFPRSNEAEAVKAVASGEMFAIYDSLFMQYSSPTYITPVKPPAERRLTVAKPLVGADISPVRRRENCGAVLSSGGKAAEALGIMKENGFNWIRLHLFVDPAAGNGYSSDGYCGLDSTLAMARRIKAADMKFLLAFHYSDSPAGLDCQRMPASWTQYGGSGLEGQLYRYTNETVKRFINEGLRPDMAQLGNEINNGFLWPQGKINGSYMPFGVLLRCASAGVRAADPSIPVMAHIACGAPNHDPVAFFDKITSRDVKFDVIGLSYHPQERVPLDSLATTLNRIAARYSKPIVVMACSDNAAEANRIVEDIPGGLGWGIFTGEAADKTAIYQQLNNTL